MPLPQGEDAWLQFALSVIPAYVAAEGAVVWPEVEARLGEGDWIQNHYDTTFPTTRGINPHVLGLARDQLEEDGTILRDPVVLSGRPVTTWLDAPGLASRSATRIRRAAATKRRLYRSFLGWTGNSLLCGHVAEQVVDRSLRDLAGRYVWLLPDQQPGQVRFLQGREIAVGGPLDAAGYAAINPRDPTAGFVPFAVEVKNVRSVLYPWSHETWDLLSKLTAFPEVLPILVARRLHFTTFRMFKDIGALGSETYRQWFYDRGTTRASIDAELFNRVRNTFGFRDAVLLDDPSTPHPPLTKFFSVTLHRPSGTTSLLKAQADRWATAAPVLDPFGDLRREDLTGPDRRGLMAELSEAIDDAGLLDAGGWGPSPAQPDDDHDPDDYA